MEGALKILVAGFDVPDNRICRNVNSYDGCESVFINGDGNQRVPECDAAIIVGHFISHDQMFRVKDYCKSHDKPFWVTGASGSFSEIKEKFEKYLIESGQPVIRRAARSEPNTLMANALKSAIEKTKEVTAPKLPPAPTPASDKLTLEQFIERHFDLGKSASEIHRAVQSSGYKNSKGTLYSVSTVYLYLDKIRKKRNLPKPPPRAKAPESEKTEKVPKRGKDDLIGRVLAAKNLTPQRKVELMEEIHAGVRTTHAQVIAQVKDDKLEITQQDIFHEDDVALLLLDKISACAIIKVLPQIRSFIDAYL